MRAGTVLACLALYFGSTISDPGLHRQRNLYVADHHAGATGPRVFEVNIHESEGSRVRRDAPEIPPPTRNSNISTWMNHLNDSHQQLMVHWVGEGSRVIICLARDPAPRKPSSPTPSALYISYDYGASFTNKTESFRLGANSSMYAQLDKFYNHPKYPQYCIFVDMANKVLFYTADNEVNIGSTALDFTPSDLTFHQYYPERFLVYDKVDPVKKLYLTKDGGRTFTLVQEFVKSFYWLWGEDDKEGTLYYERIEPTGSSQLLASPSPALDAPKKSLLRDMQDFQVKGDFMFATRAHKNGGSELLISHKRGKFHAAEFETDLPLLKFQVVDVTERRVMVTVMHADNLACLYVSRIEGNFTAYKFALSLHGVMGYFPYATWKDSWLEDVAEDAFTDLYRVEGLLGVYVASKVNVLPSQGNIGTEHLVSVMSFDHGATWNPVRPPSEDENGFPIHCRLENSCSLHLSQKFSQLYPITRYTVGERSASIVSSKSAPGIIMATGVLGKSMKGIPGVFLSRDAGVTWKRILKDYYFFNSGDHGGVLVAVKYYKSRGETRRILYSTDEGRNWNSHQFHADDLRVYGLMTEPGENTTTFTMFGSASNYHQWIIITVDLYNAFARNCTPNDYKLWSPAPPNSTMSCVLGARDTYQRRLATTNCYNGIDYDRPVKKQQCECGRNDYECDNGFTLSGSECIRNKSSKIDPYSPPNECGSGNLYMRTKGYRKIDGDICISSDYVPYDPDWIPCPMGETSEFLVVSMRDKIARIDLETNKTTFFPIQDVKNIVAIEFDLKNNCIYFADTERDKIGRQCLSNGKYSQEIIVETNLASIEGMALDWISNVLFFVDGMRNKVEAVRTDISTSGRMRRTILGPAELIKPRGIAVHPKAGYLFWTDWNPYSPMIARVNLDGTNMKKLFGMPIVEWPNGITIDQIAERIYWVDANADYIASSDLNGQYFKKVIINDVRVSHPFAVAVLKDKMYWDDWKAGAVFSADKDNGSNIVTLPTSMNALSGFMDLKVFAHFTQHGTNACSFKNTTCNAMCLGGPRNTFSCLCPDGLTGKDGHCLCPNGAEPYPNMTCPMRGNTCAPKEWRCSNGLCLSEAWRCDGDNDCGDGSDERGCEPACEAPRVSCDSGQHCLPPHWRCDGEFDCRDRTDETNCIKHNCTSSEFACGNGKCIDKKWQCDGDNDCHDGSDESGCPVVKWNGDCNEGDFRCPNSARCIPHSWRCDGEADCAGGADEVAELCANSTCSEAMFRCAGNGRCIFKTWMCDGEDDCMDGLESDEKNCSLSTPRPTHAPPPHEAPTNVCLDWMLTCKNGNCVPAWWKCDQINDCGDFTDEAGCDDVPPDTSAEHGEHISPALQGTCDTMQFTCAPGICIPLEWVCDGSPDCPAQEDEAGCGGAHRAPAQPCGADEAPCADRAQCVPARQVCDGRAQCADGSDEENCPHKGDGAVRTCPADTFSCDKGSVCLPRTSVCDSRQDCYDGADEANCTAHSAYRILGLGVDQRSITSSGFLVSCWIAQAQNVVYSFLPSISRVGSDVWRNTTFTTDNVYRFTDLEPYTQYNVTYYIRDSLTNKTVASGAYVNATTGEGEPTPPTGVFVTQLSGRRVRVVWDPPKNVKGRLVRYSVYYSPPYPPIEIYSRSPSLEILGNFMPRNNYTFWVTAHNSVYESRRSAPAVIEFDGVGDVDSLSNVSVSTVNGSAVRLSWDRVRGVEGYEVGVLMPPGYPRRSAVRVHALNYTVTDLPPGVSYQVSVSPYNGTVVGKPLTIALKTAGQREEMLEITGALTADDATAVEMHWRRPAGARYAGRDLAYHVYYTDRQNLFSGEPQIVTSNTSVVIRGLQPCKSYLLTAGLKGGPLPRPLLIDTGYNATAMAVRQLKAQIVKEQDKYNMNVSWLAGCDLRAESTVYTLEVQELNKVSSAPWRSLYELRPTDNSSVHHVIEDVSRHARFNVCVSVEGSVVRRCATAGASPPPPPTNLVAFLSPDGKLRVTFNAPDKSEGYTYEILVSDHELPRDLSRAPDALVFNASGSPFSARVAPRPGPVYVAMRLSNGEGYTSALSEVRALSVTGAELAEASWGGAGYVVALGVAGALALAAVCVHLALRHRRRADGGVSRYDSRRGQAVIQRHDEDDTPQFHGFSDDEPLVIA